MEFLKPAELCRQASSLIGKWKSILFFFFGLTHCVLTLCRPAFSSLWGLCGWFGASVQCLVLSWQSRVWNLPYTPPQPSLSDDSFNFCLTYTHCKTWKLIICDFPRGSERICLQHRRPGFNPWVGKISWRRNWQPTPVFLPRESHGHRSLVGYETWTRKELGMTEWLTCDFIFLNSCFLV